MLLRCIVLWFVIFFFSSRRRHTRCALVTGVQTFALPISLRAGVTTVRHLGAREFIDVGLRNAIAAGLTDGPRILAAGNAITATGGSCDRPPFPAQRVAPLTPKEGVCTGADQCREAVRNQIKWGADVIKEIGRAHV